MTFLMPSCHVSQQKETDEMTHRERLIAALERRKTDRLPVTTHHIMPYFTEKYMGGISSDEFFDRFGMDGIRWTVPVKADTRRGDFIDPDQGEVGFLQVGRVFSENWRITTEIIPDKNYTTTRYTVHTPGGDLSCILQGNGYTEWLTERLIKNKRDIELVAKYQTVPLCDIEAVSRTADDYGERGIIRSFIIPFDIYGQPGCWQDFCCIRGTEQAIMDTYDDPAWVHECLDVLKRRKLGYIRSMRGARYDIAELGGGDASTTVISPAIFREFVAPYDAELIAEAHRSGIRIVYHTCGGMMPILEDIADMGPDAMETFTPPDMGADVDLGEAKRRIGDRVCMIGGFDQGHYFSGCSEEKTREYARKCFREAGKNGGYIISPSDHFFDAEVRLIEAFADEARRCVYS
jgi:uroporphyrinogen decarboxylase